jgi:hypothetical protein
MNEASQVLTHRSLLNTRGFSVVPDVLSHGMVDHVNRVADRITCEAEARGGPGDGAYVPFKGDLYVAYESVPAGERPRVRQLMTPSPANFMGSGAAEIKKVAETVTGREVVPVVFTINNKPCIFGGEFPRHRDRIDGVGELDEFAPDIIVAVSCTLATAMNGGLRMLDYSHILPSYPGDEPGLQPNAARHALAVAEKDAGFLAWHERWRRKYEVLDPVTGAANLVTPAEAARFRLRNHTTRLRIGPGAAGVFRADIVHGSGVNTSPNLDRRMIYAGYRYAEPELERGIVRSLAPWRGMPLSDHADLSAVRPLADLQRALATTGV